MKIYCTLLFIFFFGSILQSQNNETWYQFRDSNELIGFKNKKGEIMVSPKFTLFTFSKSFENIIPVYEKLNLTDANDYKTSSYYLLKNGKKVGIDSLYIWDFSLDCERENKIRFSDQKAEKVGYFDTNGKVVIPAIYNDAKPFYNNLAIVIKDAKRICWEGKEYSTKNPCEHWSWIGNIMLINNKNEVLLKNLNYDEIQDLDWYSVKENTEIQDDIHINFTSKNGKIFTFIDHKKAFTKWFYDDYLKSDNKIELNNKLIIISTDSWNFPSELSFEKNPDYFTSCGTFNYEKYPCFEVIITRKNHKVVKSYHFIKTKSDYNLFDNN